MKKVFQTVFAAVIFAAMAIPALAGGGIPAASEKWSTTIPQGAPEGEVEIPVAGEKEREESIKEDLAAIDRHGAAFARQAEEAALEALADALRHIRSGDGKKALESFEVFEKWNNMVFPGGPLPKEYPVKKKLAYSLAALQYLKDGRENYGKGKMRSSETCRYLAEEYLRLARGE